MSIHVTLTIDDITYIVLEYNLGIFQRADDTGRPSSKPNAKSLDFVIETPRDTIIYEWATHPTMKKEQVKMVLSPAWGTGKSTTYLLLDVYCLHCNYDFISTGNTPFRIMFSLSPATIVRNGKVMLSRPWRITDPAMLNQPVTQREEDNEPRIIRQYITDQEDVELDSYQRGQEIYCVLESEHMADETVDIDLSAYDVSLLYRGERLQDNIIRNYTISTDEEKIPLQLIPEDYQDEQ